MSDYSKTIILIPTLNEKENLKELIPGIFGLIPDISVLIVDDNSKDGTWELVESMLKSFKNLFILKREKDFGYGKSIKDGFKWVSPRPYDYLVTIDADFSHDFKIIPALLDGLKFSDAVVGSRYVSGGGIKNWKLHRRILSRFANFYTRIILGIAIQDMTTGFMCFKKDILKEIDLNSIKSDGYAFLVEFKYRAIKNGFKTTEHPIIFIERREGESKMSSKIIWESVWMPWRLRFFSSKK